MRRLTSEIIDQKLIGRNIKRIEEYKNHATSIKWQCLKLDCNFTWDAKPNNILNGKSCPQCAGNIKLTNHTIDERLIDKNLPIKRIDDYINIQTKIKWKCLINTCNYDWEAKPDNVLNKFTGCPQCSNRVPFSNEIVDQKLFDRNIKRIDNFINSNIPMKWMCLIENCNYIWETNASNILNAYSGCPKCNLPGMNEKLMHQVFKDANLEYEFQFCINKIDNNVRRLYFDAYFPELKLAIEYNGSQHYELTNCFGAERPKEVFIKQQKRDEYLREFCIKHNIKLIEIDGRIFRTLKLKNYLINNIIPTFLM